MKNFSLYKELIEKVHIAHDKYYKENPCFKCGPGNGCDDCRGCEDKKLHCKLEKEYKDTLKEFEDTLGVSYNQVYLCEQIIQKEEEYNKKTLYCKLNCGGILHEDCFVCSSWHEIFNIHERIEQLKQEYSRRYKTDYKELQEQINKNIIMKNINKQDLKIDNGIFIKEWISNNVKKYGAKNFFNCVNDSWSDINESIKQLVINEITEYIKPEEINTIEDLAKLLDGNEYRDELSNEYGINICDLCKKNHWVVIYGASDDLIEFDGFISDEDGAWDGTIVKLVKPGDFYLDDEDDETYKKAKDYQFVSINESTLKELKDKNYKDECVIEMLWCPENFSGSWQVNVKGAPFAKFNVMEDGELYCEAAIIDISKFVK